MQKNTLIKKPLINAKIYQMNACITSKKTEKKYTFPSFCFSKGLFYIINNPMQSFKCSIIMLLKIKLIVRSRI